MNNEKKTSEQPQGHAPLTGVSCRFLEVGDVIYVRKYHGVLNHNYRMEAVKVVDVSKTLAYLSNGQKAYRKPRKHTMNDGWHWRIKGGNAVYRNGN